MPLADRRPLLRGISALLSPVSSKHVHIMVDLPPTPSASSGMLFAARRSPSAVCTPASLGSDGCENQDVKMVALNQYQADSSQGSQDSTPSSKLRLPTEVCTKKFRLNLPRPMDTMPQASPWGMSSQNQNRPRALMLMTPSSCASPCRDARIPLSPATPDPTRNSFAQASPRGMSLKSQNRPRAVMLTTPSSCASPSRDVRVPLSPATPDPTRNSLKHISGDATVIFFDFDGTLTATPGEFAQRPQKVVELKARATLLEPRLRELRNAGFVLSIMSKSTEHTIRSALDEAGLLGLFDGPIVGKAVGFEGKAGFIDDIVSSGYIDHLSSVDLSSVLLIDDDVRELDRARSRGMQTYAAPAVGGLKEADFDEIFAGLGVVGPSHSMDTLDLSCRSSSSGLFVSDM